MRWIRIYSYSSHLVISYFIYFTISFKFYGANVNVNQNKFRLLLSKLIHQVAMLDKIYFVHLESLHNYILWSQWPHVVQCPRINQLAESLVVVPTSVIYERVQIARYFRVYISPHCAVCYICPTLVCNEPTALLLKQCNVNPPRITVFDIATGDVGPVLTW